MSVKTIAKSALGAVGASPYLYGLLAVAGVFLWLQIRGSIRVGAELDELKRQVNEQQQVIESAAAQREAVNAEAEQRIALAEAERDEARRSALALTRSIQLSREAEREARAAARAVPDDQVLAAVRADIGSPEIAPQLSVLELRQVHEQLARITHLETQMGQLEERDAQRERELAAVAETNTQLRGQLAAERQYSDELYRGYVIAYNFTQRRRGFWARTCAIVTLGLACRAKRLTLPAPQARVGALLAAPDPAPAMSAPNKEKPE